MKTFEVYLKNSIGNNVSFEVETDTETEAINQAFEEMEGEGFCMNSILSHGYSLHSIEEVSA